MKFMGSKRWMLSDGLGELLRRKCTPGRPFADLFTGSGAVACYVAENTESVVEATDIQTFAVVLANAVLERTHPTSAEDVLSGWIGPALAAVSESAEWESAPCTELQTLSASNVAEARRWASEKPGPITSMYGGHYFSPRQALVLDKLLETIPTDRDAICRAALIDAASRCAASPGHTAQPFQPTPKGLVAIRAAWRQDPEIHARAAVRLLARRHSRVLGRARVSDATLAASTLTSATLAFVDPPYSAAQYSRFYHVLETIARGTKAEVEGSGRYPPFSQRPWSAWSTRSGARQAMAQLLRVLAEVGCETVITYPETETSNGLSELSIKEAAAGLFEVTETHHEAVWSTLGGNGSKRSARLRRSEAILVLTPLLRTSS